MQRCAHAHGPQWGAASRLVPRPSGQAAASTVATTPCQDGPGGRAPHQARQLRVVLVEHELVLERRRLAHVQLRQPEVAALEADGAIRARVVPRHALRLAEADARVVGHLGAGRAVEERQRCHALTIVSRERQCNGVVKIPGRFPCHRWNPSIFAVCQPGLHAKVIRPAPAAAATSPSPQQPPLDGARPVDGREPHRPRE